YKLTVKVTPADEKNTEKIEFSIKGTATFQVLGFEFTVMGLTLINDRDTEKEPGWAPEARLQGKLKLPEKLTGGDPIEIVVGGKDAIVINSTGVSVSGGKIEFGDKRTFNLLGVLKV